MKNKNMNKYKELVMFDAGDPIQQIELCDHETICLLCEENSGKRAITVLTLPSKVTQTSVGSGEIQQNSDLKIKSGFFPPSTPRKILAIYEENRLLTTSNEYNGLLMYNIKASDTDQIDYNTTLNFSITDPEIALVNKNTVILTKDADHKSIIGDLNSGEILREFIVDETEYNTLIPVCLNESVVAFSEKLNGTTHLYDSRISEMIGIIYAGEEEDIDIFPTSNYSYITKLNPSNKMYFLSKTGIFKVYDVRNTLRSLIRHDLKLSTTEEYLKVHFKPENSNLLSISGFDSNLYIFDVSKNMTQLFKHDGHSRTEDCEKDTLVTDHLWHPNEFVISGALNQSINCWIPETNNKENV